MAIYQKNLISLASLVSAFMLAGCGSSNSVAIQDSSKPVLTIHQNFATTSNQSSIQLSGKAQDNQAVNVSVISNHTTTPYVALVNTTGDFNIDVPLVDGENILTITAKDLSGNTTTQSITIFKDSVAPTLVLNNDLKNAISRTSEIILIGTVSDNHLSGLSLTLSHQDTSQTVSINEKGEFRTTLALNAGENKIKLVAKDASGNEQVLQEKVYFGQTLTGAGSHTGILDNGKVYAFGRNNFGQVGIGETTTLAKNSNHPKTPVLVRNAPSNVVAISFNQNHSALLTKDGKVYTWGSDSQGELGRGSLNKHNCASGKNNCRLDIGMVEGLSEVVAISSGYSHKLALTKTGEVWAFGSNSQGQIGQDTSLVKSQDTPVKVDFSAHTNMGKIIQVIASSDASYALDNKGQVFAWGSNEYANLGNGAVCDENDASLTPNCVKNSFKPILVPLQDIKITELAVGRDHVLALNDKGQVYAWGLNFSSQVGYKGEDKAGLADAWAEVIEKPTLLPWSNMKPVKHVFANGTTSYAMLKDNKVYPWGQFGETDANGKTNYAELSEPTDKLPNLTNVYDMGVGALHQIARRDTGDIYSWGWSFEGSLGGQDISNIWMYNTPILVTLAP